MKALLLLCLLPLQLFAQPFSAAEISRWENQAKQITIIRDHYGVPHIYGKTDADAVFGLLYAQCEDDFKRVELNYIEKLGRLSEINGEKDLYNDLMIRLLIDSADAVRDYTRGPGWLKKILDAFSDGINYYLYKHPKLKPALLHRFQPWFPLLWTDGSIGAISTGGITVTELKRFYSGNDEGLTKTELPGESPTGSNGFAISPAISETGNALFYINPHVTFYFRPEVHMNSEEGMNVYGAVTWGQPFIYQGFNAHCGWMHTSSKADISDAYIEKLTRKNGSWFYTYEGKQKKVIEKNIQILCKTTGGFETRSFKTLFTHHGPVMAKRNGQYLSLRHNNRDTKGFMQSWLRTRANSFAAFKKTMEMGANPSNNTVYADAEGNIAYWHGNFMPRRDPRYNWNEPVDGSTRSTEWKGYHSLDEIVHLYNPPNGWIQNCNSTPFTVAGKNSPKKEDFPFYMAPDGENFRGLNAVRVLGEENKFTLDKLIGAGYDTRLTFFELLIPALISAYEKDPLNDSIYGPVKDVIRIFRKWDHRCSVNDVATTLAVEWAEKLEPAINRVSTPEGLQNDMVYKTRQYASAAPATELINALWQVMQSLQNRYGKWEIPWGEVNRFQRISTDIDYKFDDTRPSIPVGFVSSTWGMLPSYSSIRFPGTNKRYGVHGNSFICAVEFGKRIKAKSLLAGGQSGDPDSPHFFDQGEMYSKGIFKDVLFYKEDVLKHVERNYHPGE